MSSVEKARKEWKWMLEEIVVTEDDHASDRQLMGDACKRLREAHGIARNAVAQELRMDAMQVALLERACSSTQARTYRRAVESLAKARAS